MARSRPEGGQPGGTALVWLRQDLRLADNPALVAASAAGRPVTLLYVLDEEAAGLWAPGGAHRWWLHGSLEALSADCRAAGVALVLRRGRATDIVPEVARAASAGEVHAGSLPEPWARRQQQAVQEALGGIGLHMHRASTLFDLDAIKTKTGGVYGVYTPFANTCRAHPVPPPLPVPAQLRAAPSVPSDDLGSWGLLPTKPDWASGFRDTWTPGEAGGHQRLTRFVAEHIDGYEVGRNLPGAALTSMLSPHLHWGELSPAQVWHSAREAGQGKSHGVFTGEILWHEFAAYLLWHYPHLPEQPLRSEFGRLQWRMDGAGLEAWQQGRTGVPIVDAGMRQLWHIGWMHNRVRMITASFLVKHLLVSWQDGERWFWDTLVDGDLAANSASWQWIAGCGTDSQPFFRVFNPVTQGEKFDADGAYVRRWVPEIAAIPDRWLQAPWTAPADVLAKAEVVLGKTYPVPLVDLATGRDRALAAFRTMRQAA